MKKFSILSFIIAFSFAIFNLIHLNPVNASVQSDVEILQSAYEALCEYDQNGGCLSQENLSDCYLISGQGLLAVENLYSYYEGEGVSSQDRIAFSVKREKVLKVYRDTTKKKLSALYNPDNYAHTQNGAIKLTSDYQTAISAIDAQDATKSTIDIAYQTFYDLVEEGGYVKNSSTLYSDSQNGLIQGSLKRIDDKLVFSPDDKLVINDYKSSATIKNVNIAIKNQEGLVSQKQGDEKSYYGHGFGVAYYYDIHWESNGKYNVIDKECLLTIDFSSVETTLEEGQGVYVVSYKGNGEITLSDELIIENGKISFTISSSGAYAIVADGYGIANSSKFVWFMQQYWIYLLIILLIILLIALPMVYNKRLKKKMAKRRNKDFKKFLKEEKRNKKLAKKEKRNKKRLKNSEDELNEKQELKEDKSKKNAGKEEQPLKKEVDKKEETKKQSVKDKNTINEEEKFISEDKQIEKILKSKEDEDIKKALSSKEDEEIKKVLNKSDKSK